MPRAIWSGSISFGLVNIPVKLYSAVNRKNVRFNLLDSRTGSRIKNKRVSAEGGEEVPPEDLVRGYEVTPGSYVTISDEDLAGLDPEGVRTIDIDEFVDLDEIEPLLFDNGYYLAPEGPTSKAYALLSKALGDLQKVAIANFVMRAKRYLAAIRSRDGVLVMSTMLYSDELNDPAAIPEIEALEEVDLPEKELAMAQSLIDSLSADFDPERFHDTYRESVMEMIDKKAAGEDLLAAPEAPSPQKVVDLMEALEASVAEAKESRKAAAKSA